MKNKIAGFYKPPNFPNDEFKSTAASVLNVLLLSILAVLVLWGALAIPFIVYQKATGGAIALGLSVVILGLRQLMRRGNVRLASGLFLSFWWLSLTILIIYSGGMNSIVLICYASTVVMAGVLLGPRATVGMALVCTATGLAMMLVAAAGKLPPRYFPAQGVAAWLTLASAMFWTTVPVYIALRDLQQAHQRSKHQVAEISQIQAVLRDSEQRFRTLSEAAFEGVAISQAGLYVDLSDQLAVMLGYRREELIGRPVVTTVAEKDRPLVTEAIQTRNLESYQLHALRKDGNEFPVAVRARLITTTQGELRLTAVRDITNLVEAEKTLRESEQRYRMLFESNPIPMWVYDLETLAFLAVNESAIRRYGYSREEFLGMTIKDIRPETDIPALLNNIGNVTSGLDEAGVWKHRKKDGTLIYVEITSHTVTFKDRPAEIVMANDVTERVRSLDTLKKERAFLRQVVDAVPGFVLVKDQESRFVLVNQALAEAYQLTVEEMIGKTEADFGMDPAEVKRLEDHDRDVFRTRQIQYIPERLQAYKNGEEHWLSTVLVPLLDSDGSCPLLLIITMDITSLKQAEASLRKSEEEIRKLNAELEQRVFERTEQLAAANRELEAFSYTVSHDLRAPLRAIDGYSRILQEDFDAELSPEASNLLKIVRENTHFMGRLIDGLLAFSRLGRQPLNCQLFSSADIVRQELDKLVQEHPAQKIEAKVGELPVCMGDPMLIRQVWTNLLSNAAKFSRNRATTSIEITCETQADEIIFSIHDNGIGFDMKHANQLFGVFQRLNPAEAYEGTGVGLAIVERIIRRHGGRVWAEAKVDQGAIFYFSLPTTDATPA